MMTNSEIVNVVMSHSEGKKIQMVGINEADKDINWRDVGLLRSWNFDRYDYRVSPRDVPIEKWMNIRRDGGWSWYDTKEEADKYFDRETIEIVHLREVIK